MFVSQYYVLFTGNQTSICNETGTEGDYCTAYSYPHFDIIKRGETNYVLKIPIINDEILESTEFVHILAIPPSLPAGSVRCSTVLLIVDDDDGKMCTYVNLHKIPT